MRDKARLPEGIGTAQGFLLRGELKAVATFLAFLFLASSLWPFGYPLAQTVTQNAEQLAASSSAPACGELEMSTIKTHSTDCAYRVQTEELTWSEYYGLLAAGANGTIDAFGDSAAYAQQKAYDQADLADEGSVNGVKDQFLLTNQGKTVMLFDALQHRFVNPSESGCYLSSLVANGRMSYITEVDANTRICSEHYATGEGKQCAYGHLSEPAAKNLQAVSESNKRLLEAYNELNKDSPDYDSVKKLLDKSCSDSLVCGAYSALISSKNRTVLQKLVVQASGATDLSQFGDNPLNIITSNKTTAQLEQVNDGQVWMFPVWLVYLLQSIRAREGEEQWYLVFSWGPMVIGLASLKAPGNAAGKAIVAAGMDVEKAGKAGEKAAKWLSRLKTVLKGGMKEEEFAADAGKACKKVAANGNKMKELAEESSKEIEQKWAKELTMQGPQGPLPILDPLSQNLKTVDRVSQEEITSAFKQAGKGDVANVQNGAFKLRPGAVDNSEMLEAQYKTWGQLYGRRGGRLTSADLGDPTKIQETRDFLKFVEETAPNTPSAKYAGALFKDFEGISNIGPESAVRFTEALGKNAGGVAAVDGVVGGIKGEKLIGDALVDQYYKMPNAGKKMREWTEQATKAGSYWGKGGKIALSLKLWAAQRGLALLRGAERNVYISRAAQLVDFGLTNFFEHPVPVYVTRGLRFELQPQSSVIGNEPSYLEVGKLSTIGSADTMPRDFFSTLFKFMNIDLKETFGAEMNPANYKMQNIGDYVAIVDQETPAAMYSKKPKNFINPTNGKWSFLNINPDATDAYDFEHPDAYYQTGSDKYTAMALVSRNLNLSNVVVEQDLATYGAANALHAVTPSSDFFAAFTLIGGAIDFASGLPGRSWVARRGIGAILTWQLSTVLSGVVTDEVGRTAQELRVGGAVNLAEAYKSGELCKDVEKTMEDKIGGAAAWMYGTLGFNYITSSIATATMFLAPTGPVGWAAIGITMAVDIVIGWWNSKTTEAYTAAKEKAVDEMKKCKETEFKIFAWGKIPTDAGEKDILAQGLKDLSKGLSSTLGPVLNAVSPEAKQALDSVAQGTYHNTLLLRSSVSGESLTNVYGSKVYQVHFDPETDINWMLGSAVTAEGKPCPLSLCYEQSDGSFKCLTAQGYELRDVNGNLILNGSQVLGAKWDNLEQYFSIPQKVINVNNTGSLGNNVLLEFNSEKKITDKCTMLEIRNLTKTTDFDTIFGEFAGAYTDNAVVWNDGNAVTVRFTREAGMRGEGQIVTIPDADITLHKNGTLFISGLEEGLTMRPASDDYMMFANAKITPGKTAPYLNTLHIITRVLLSFNIRDAKDYDITGLCSDPENATKAIGMQFSLDLTKEADKQRANEILQDICFTDIRGLNDERVSIQDNKMCITDINNKTVCYEIDSAKSGNGIISLIDPKTGQELRFTLERGPNGEPQFVLRDANGNPVGAPIPLLWATGMGGSMMYDPKNGQISIKNEFPFAINPNFGIYGAGGSGMMFPQAAITGGNPRTPITGTQPSTNPLAALPGVPTEAFEITVFAAALIAGLLIIRGRQGSRTDKKRKTQE